MKKITVFIVALLCVHGTAQNINDVLRYSVENLSGTARFQAMGGAFGALGGDLSALNSNPAGSSVFNYGQLTVSGTYFHRDNTALYGNTLTNTEFNATQINQLGGVFVLNSSNDNTPWKKIALAVNYDMVRNFDNEFNAIGSTNQGIDTYFLNYADGIPFEPLQLLPGETVVDAYRDIGSSLGFAEQQAFLGYQAGIISPTTDAPDTNTYQSNANYETVNQNYRQNVNGYNSRFTLNFSGQYEENVHVGASLNFHSVLYDRLMLFDEDGYLGNSDVQTLYFDNLLLTTGEGFSFSVGGLAKLNDGLRIGGSYQSPTWYRLTDELSQEISSNNNINNIDILRLDVVNIFPEYRIKTPAKFTGSAALVFGKQGLLSFDYGYQDFTQAELRPSSDVNFAAENNYIAQVLKPVNSYRVGGEFRFENISLRGGYRLEESPYEDTTIMGDLEAFSGGIGINFGPNRLDLALTRTEQDVTTFLFDSEIVANNTTISRVNTNVGLSYTMKF